ASGAISGVPTIGAATGTHTVRVTASDAVASSSGNVELRVMAAGRADLGVSASVSPNPVLSDSAASFTFAVTNSSNVAVGNASLDVTFTAGSPFVIDAVSDPSCLVDRGSGT